MSRTIEFTVPAVPVAQPRGRATASGGRARIYSHTTNNNNTTGDSRPHPIVAFKATVRMAASEAYTGPPLLGPLRVDVLAVFPRHSDKIWKRKPMPRYRHVEKPDRDNLDKAVLDALKGITWRDDCQICDGRIQKWRASGDEQPHVVITITEV